MSKQIVTVVACAIFFVAALSSCYGATLPSICKPGAIENMPPHLQKVCLAAENSIQLASDLEAYIKEAAASLPKPDGKRTDIDHIFLPFGKRR